MSKLKQIENKVGKLSNPSKMPAFSWGIPTEYCKTGMKLAKIEGTICNKCYAGKGCYVFPIVKVAYQKRYDAIEIPEWVDYMVELLTIKYKNLDKSRLFHRWFDSGDLQSVEHLQKIFEICRQTPHIKHWLATREYQIVKHFKEEDVPENLCLRVSALEVDGAIPKFWQWTSGVHKDKRHRGKECRAYTTNNECGSCRACWDRKVKQVSYKEH
jgi:hypothetical protein